MSVVSENLKSPTTRLSLLIKELRGKTSQREFAKLLGISYTTIQDWEKQIRLPNSKNLQRLSKLKGWTQAELLHHLFSSGVQVEHQNVDPIEHMVSNLQNLSPEQMQILSEYLELRMTFHRKTSLDIQK